MAKHVARDRREGTSEVKDYHATERRAVIYRLSN